MNSPQLFIKRFLLLGKRKNYEIPPFKEGLNIIHGSTDTGKSMILRLIHYCLGKYQLSKRSAEIDDACTDIVVELLLNGKIITIKRDIHKPTKPIEIFYDSIDNIKRQPDELYHISGTQKYKNISSFLLDKLGVPYLEVPYAPNDPDKGYNAVSIKDIINVIYLNDEEIGSPLFLKAFHPNKHIKFIESLKALLKIEGSQIREIQHIRNIKNKERNELKSFIKEVGKFLLENNIINKNEIEFGLSKVKNEIEIVDKGIKELNKQVQENSYISTDLNNEILSKKETITKLNEDIQITNQKLIEFRELVNAYNSSLERKQSLLELGDLVDTEHHICPLCKSVVESEIQLSTDFIQADMSDLNHRIFDLKEIIEENENLLTSMKRMVIKEVSDLKVLEDKNSQEFETYLSPLLKQRDEALVELGRSKEILKNMEEKYKILTEFEFKKRNINKMDKEIEELDIKLESLKKNLKKRDEVIIELSRYFSEFIEYIKQLSAKNPRIDNRFIPYITIEDQELSYYQVPGTAKKVVLSVAYYTALFKYCLLNNTYIPKLLIIDGPSSGRGTNPQDPAERIDIEVYNAMFSYWKKLLEERSGNNTQLIIVDNTLPPEFVKEDILITFDKSEDGPRKGLIDDL